MMRAIIVALALVLASSGEAKAQDWWWQFSYNMGTPGGSTTDYINSFSFRGIGFQRMRAELFDINRRRRRKALRAEHVEAGWTAVRVGPGGQAVQGARLVAGHQRRAVADGGIGAGQIGDARFVGHIVYPGCPFTTSTARRSGGRSGPSCRTTGR